MSLRKVFLGTYQIELFQYFVAQTVYFLYLHHHIDHGPNFYYLTVFLKHLLKELN